MNMGYPLLDEDSIISIPSEEVLPRDGHAAKDLNNWMHMQKPTEGFQEQCYYHRFSGNAAVVSITQPKLDSTLSIRFDPRILDGFVEWKMMGVRDYVLGLECGNCYPDGRAAMRESGMLKFLNPGERQDYTVEIAMH